jgi:GNAT superfamily N-acetyltransferase
MTDEGSGSPGLPVTVDLPTGTVLLRRATAADLPGLVAVLADDPLAAARGDSAGPEHAAAYARAFQRIDADPHDLLLVAERDGRVVGTLQISSLVSLSRGGAERLQIEAVRVAASERGRGIGRAMIDWACAEGVRRGAALVQLTSDRARTGAHAFYERLGFTPSHVGFKQELTARG